MSHAITSDSVLLDAVRSIRWAARKRAPGGLSGDHLSRVLGISPEFTEYRAYRQGDDTQRIDWKLLARSDRAYVRLSNDRTLLPTVLLVDASASLAYPTATLEKWHYARQMAIGLAAAAHGSGDPVGLVVATTGGALRLPSRTRRGVVQDISRVLGAIVPAGDSEMAPMLATLRPVARIVIISDFLGDSQQLLRNAAYLNSAGREVHAVHVLHAAELDPPRNTALMTDPERPHIKRPLTENTRRQYIENFRVWRETLAREWRMTGAYYTQVVTTEAVSRSIRLVAAPGMDGQK
ncbi:MAG: DUF58 domain-containing protein [Gemmatimonadaceae bacterium]|nr:DUF58 domain-containing protein [Gemmatimonadaceae bacterium]